MGDVPIIFDGGEKNKKSVFSQQPKKRKKQNRGPY
jgi:hypothetical protein